jgi:flavodoxin
MKTLVVYYSRTGTTKQLAETIAAKLHADTEEIIDTKNRAGPIGWIMAGKDGSSEATTVIEQTKHDPRDFDVVIIGTPIWAGKMASGVRTYILQKEEELGEIAFFITAGSEKVGQCFLGLEQVAGHSPVAKLSLTTKEVRGSDISGKVEAFANEVKDSANSG